MKMEKRIKIRGKWIGDGSPCFIIAEAGANHDRSLEQAKRLIDVAAEAGADAVKFQIYSAKTLYSQMLDALPGESDKPFDVIKRLEMPREWIPVLAGYSKEKGLIFLSTPFDREAVDQLDHFVPAFKWASPELIDRPLLEYASRKGKPFIISTGFYGLKEIQDALDWIRKAGKGRAKAILLHCAGLYPTLHEEVNLRAMLAIKDKFHVLVGYSDHTLDTVTPAAAVALGAKVIEKHFTLSRKLKGPDHPFALEPQELKEMVGNIRCVEKSLGSGIKKPVSREITKEKLIRQGIVAAIDLKKGEKITSGNITTKRVGEGGILPKYFSSVLGKKVIREVKADQKITWGIIGKRSIKK